MLDPNIVMLYFNILNFLDYVRVIWQKSIIKNEKISELYVDIARFFQRTYLSLNRVLVCAYFFFSLM